jgi:hypothetical protein
MGTMHAFPAASESVTVLNGGDGAGSITVAGGDENRGGAGASHGNSTAVPRVSAWGGRADSPSNNISARTLYRVPAQAIKKKSKFLSFLIGYKVSWYRVH